MTSGPPLVKVPENHASLRVVGNAEAIRQDSIVKLQPHLQQRCSMYTTSLTLRQLNLNISFYEDCSRYFRFSSLSLVWKI